MPLSSESSSCRIDWRPSRLLCVALAALGLLAALAIGLSALPLAFKPVLAALAAWHGLRLARQEWRRPPCSLEFGAPSEPLLMRTGEQPAEPMLASRLALRGALATLAWREPGGRRRTLAWCADTLPVAARRQLRLRLSGQGGAA